MALHVMLQCSIAIDSLDKNKNQDSGDRGMGVSIWSG
jgi:hypothetical protein